MGRTSRYSRNRASSASVSYFSISSSLIGAAIMAPGGPLRPRAGGQGGTGRRALGIGLESGGDLADAEERPAVDGARPVPLERVPVTACAVSPVRVEPVHRESP